MPVLASPVYLPRRVGRFLHPLVPTLASQSLIGSACGLGMDWMSLSKVSGSAVSVKRIFPSSASNFNRLICNRLTSFLVQPVFQYLPVIPCGLIIRLLRQNLNYVDTREIPFLSRFVVDTSDLKFFKKCEIGFHDLSNIIIESSQDKHAQAVVPSVENSQANRAKPPCLFPSTLSSCRAALPHEGRE